MKHLISLWILVLIGFSSCENKKITYEKTVNFPNYQWNRFNTLEFTPEIKKLKKIHEFTIVLRYQEGYPYETLPVNTVLTYPDGQKNILRYVFAIKNEQGYIGLKEGNTRQLEAVIYTDKTFAEKGVYTFSIQQLTQYYDLNYIVSVGCKVSSHSSKTKK
ncbi:MAG: hypothetical protein WC142_07200 [Bacteroidales bacterium]|jgi:gliding motility-associated lipoprotein GldH|nr:hypothetical protein [Bacteroidales bacterium]MDD2688014.1 hypothetical protein [Bacteroidales bacterium]MDD3331143.1 hypothetical protein [Bacteroidales bacterium]MDD3691052.1 hypothetical protein [Bacteroidales bacterium]MDD4044501.1 hypothetical protein [Bacteroidales bacterium]